MLKNISILLYFNFLFIKESWKKKTDPENSALTSLGKKKYYKKKNKKK